MGERVCNLCMDSVWLQRTLDLKQLNPTLMNKVPDNGQINLLCLLSPPCCACRYTVPEPAHRTCLQHHRVSITGLTPSEVMRVLKS